MQTAAGQLYDQFNQFCNLLERADSPISDIIANNIELTSRLNELKRIFIRLEQYSRSQKSLTYIGFIGHFNSGKSSTINNVFNIIEPGEKRAVGDHPTDDAITLCTHSKNSNVIYGTYAREHIAVHVHLLDVESLEDFVAVDTPGSGELSSITEMVHDFLPVCDRIVFLFNSRAALTDSDIPLLRQLNDVLPFIPTTYVITHVDLNKKFKIRPGDPISDGNINVEEINSFLHKLLERMVRHSPKVKVGVGNFRIIDNESGYGIDLLREHLKGSIDKIELHAQKIQYFTNTLGSVEQYFIKSTQRLLEAAVAFLVSAQKNQDEYFETLQLKLFEIEKSFEQRKSEFRNKATSFEDSEANWKMECSQAALYLEFGRFIRNAGKLPTPELALFPKLTEIVSKKVTETLKNDLEEFREYVKEVTSETGDFPFSAMCPRKLSVQEIIDLVREDIENEFEKEIGKFCKSVALAYAQRIPRICKTSARSI